MQMTEQTTTATPIIQIADRTIEDMQQSPTGRIDQLLLVKSATVKKTKTGSSFVDMTLRDSTGDINAKCWDECIAPDYGSVIRVVADVGTYAGSAQLTVHEWAEATGDVDISTLVATSHRPAVDLWDSVWSMVTAHCSEGVVQLLGWISYDAKQRLMESPAASSNHHARLGGLVEHVYSMCTIAMLIADHYERMYGPVIDRGLLLAGIVLHDVGKVLELSGPVSTTYTTEGRLIGHIPMGLLMLEGHIAKCNPALTDDEVLRIRHMILSHHGRQEWGSPVLPQTPEAIVLHHLDMLDSRVDTMAHSVRLAGDDGWVAGDYKRPGIYVGAKDDR